MRLNLHRLSSAWQAVLPKATPSPLFRSTGMPLLSQASHPTQQPMQMQQCRSRWTKAKKKRTIRHARRQVMEEKGIPLSKPPYYFPRDTPVIIRKSPATSDSNNGDILQSKLQERMQQRQQMLRKHMQGLTMSDRVRKLFDLHNGSQKEVIAAQKQQGMQLFQLREGDTGSSAVQVIALTTRIQQLQTHMAQHKKDVHSKRGMDALYVRRRKLLDYMERKEFDSYRAVVKMLGLVRS